jgi:flagellar motor switch protein FliN/FliY
MTDAETITRYTDIPLSVESELGQCTLPVREILSLAPGSVIKLSSAVGSKVALYVGGSKFGSGEMMKIGAVTAVRVTDFAKKSGAE